MHSNASSFESQGLLSRLLTICRVVYVETRPWNPGWSRLEWSLFRFSEVTP